jgi:transposase InsO family protein
MSRDNPRWGTERIRGELRTLGLAVRNRSIRRSRRPGSSRPPRQTWRTFLAHHLGQVWAADLFTVQTLTFRTLSVVLVITHGRRALVHGHVTAHPTAAWVWRQLSEATPWGRQPRSLLWGRGAVDGGDVVPRARRLSIEPVLTPVRASRPTALAARVIGTLRRACLDHLLVLHARHLRAVLRAFVRQDNAERPHRSLGLQTPRPAACPDAGPVRSRPILGGLHKCTSAPPEHGRAFAV